MRIVLSIFVGLCLILNAGCSVGEPAIWQGSNEVTPGYDITIRVFDFGNSFDKVMDIFSKNGLSIVHVHHIFFPGERQEIRVTLRNGDNKLLNEVEYQLRSVLNVENVSIRRI